MSAADRPWVHRIAAARKHPRPFASEVTLVIPTVGRDVLERCLSAVLDGTVWPKAVVVADQGGNRNIAAWLADLEGLGIEAYYEPVSGRGRALGLNAGLRRVTTPFVVITDDDCIPQPEWIESFEAALRKYPGTAITGRVEAAGDQRVINTVSDPTPAIARRPRVDYDRLSGGNCGMGMDILEKVGLFDEDPCLRNAEDGEWAYRALRSHVPIVYAPELAVAHLGWRTIGDRLAQYRSYARSHAAFFGKHLRHGDLFMVLRAAVHFARAATRWLRGKLRGDAELAANGRSYVTQLLPGIISGMTSRIRPPSL